ncbi:MAG: hypothetical protein ACRDZX_09765 [Acidimicrobiales bacterium]
MGSFWSSGEGTGPDRLHFSEVGLGQLLAEGGEGRVFEVARPPRSGGRDGLSGGASPLVYKHLRQPRPLSELAAIVGFPSLLDLSRPGLATRALRSSAWPTMAVVGDDPELAVGALMPRAPAPFWLKHRDGTNRLATLSYLASDPDRMAVAYGVQVPAPGAPERIALLFALSRLLDAWQHPDGPHVVHGDLSAKNILWSTDPAPAIYVLDCDGATVTAGVAGAGPEEEDEPGGAGGKERLRLRATTPNWDDPALSPGTVPTEATDCYAIGLAFLRVVGAANFPLQARQRAGGVVNVDLALPRTWRRLPDMPGLWALCERSLSVANAPGRPSPAEWSAHLEELLGLLGAADLGARARAAQGDPAPSGAGGPASLTSGRAAERATAWVTARVDVTVPDVAVRPVLGHRTTSTWELISPRPVAGAASEPMASAGPWVGLSPRQAVQRTLLAWAGAHRLAARLVRSPGRMRHGLRRLAGVVVLDLAAACVVLFLVGMIVSPWIGL